LEECLNEGGGGGGRGGGREEGGELGEGGEAVGDIVAGDFDPEPAAEGAHFVVVVLGAAVAAGGGGRR